MPIARCASPFCLIFILFVGCNSWQFASADPQDQSKESPGGREFAGLRFGVGLSLTKDMGNDDRIDTAEIIDGIVRVTSDSNSVARIMLESHYFFTPEKQGGSLFRVQNGNWGIGPFIAIQPGTDEIIEAIGAGFMIGFKRAGENSSSWNFGIGLVVDPNVRILGDGFSPNAAPPGNETQVRFKETSQTGLLLVTSFSF